MSPIEDSFFPAQPPRASTRASATFIATCLAASLAGCALQKTNAAQEPAMEAMGPSEPTAEVLEPVAASSPNAPLFHCDPALEAQDLAMRHLLSTHERLLRQTQSELIQSANRVELASFQALIDQALALGMTHTPGDIARAQSLLDSILRNNTPQAEPWRRLARLLSTLYAEQRRADEQVERTNQQFRDAQRDNQRRLDQLNDKLEALKAIERSLNTRPGPTPKPNP